MLWFGSRGNESPSSGALATPRAYGVRRFYHLASRSTRFSPAREVQMQSLLGFVFSTQDILCSYTELGEQTTVGQTTPLNLRLGRPVSSLMVTRNVSNPHVVAHLLCLSLAWPPEASGACHDKGVFPMFMRLFNLGGKALFFTEITNLEEDTKVVVRGDTLVSSAEYRRFARERFATFSENRAWTSSLVVHCATDPGYGVGGALWGPGVTGARGHFRECPPLFLCDCKLPCYFSCAM